MGLLLCYVMVVSCLTCTDYTYLVCRRRATVTLVLFLFLLIFSLQLLYLSTFSCRAQLQNVFASILSPSFLL